MGALPHVMLSLCEYEVAKKIKKNKNKNYAAILSNAYSHNDNIPSCFIVCGTPLMSQSQASVRRSSTRTGVSCMWKGRQADSADYKQLARLVTWAE